LLIAQGADLSADNGQTYRILLYHRSPEQQNFSWLDTTTSCCSLVPSDPDIASHDTRVLSLFCDSSQPNGPRHCYCAFNPSGARGCGAIDRRGHARRRLDRRKDGSEKETSRRTSKKKEAEKGYPRKCG
jgi:hypothetical protein